MLYAVIAVALVLLDQVVKFLVRANIPLYTSVTLIPGVMDLTYVQNTGAAFSLLNEHTWVLTLLSAVVSVGILIVMAKGIFDDRLGRLSLALLLGGAVGNLIDRALFGFVTDMFETTFMHFAIFNVADIGVVVGGVLLCIHVIRAFFQEWKQGKEGAGS